MPVDLPKGFDLTNVRHRQTAAKWLEERNLKPSDDIVKALNEPPGSLSAEQKRRLKYFLSTGRDVHTTGVFRRPQFIKAITPTHQYVERADDDHLGAFIDRMPFKLSNKMRVPVGDGKYISVLSLREWGSQKVDLKTKDFREPRHAKKVLAVWRFLDGKAKEHGMRVDPWEVFAAVYPPVRKMLKTAGDRNHVIYVRIPSLMRDRRFSEHNYKDFALAAWQRKLGQQYADGTGLKYGTRSSQTRGVERPRVSTLKNFAGAIAHDAIAGDDYKREVYRYLFLLTRIIPVLSHEVPGKRMGLVPVVNRDGSLLYDLVDPRVATKYTVCVLPDDRTVASYMMDLGNAKQNWPSSSIQNGEFDFKLKLIENRLKVFSLPFFNLKISRDDGSSIEVPELYQRLESYRVGHGDYSEKLASSKASDRELIGGQDHLRSHFYRNLNRFVQATLRYTHARGVVHATGIDIKFELVPKVSGVWVVSPSSKGYVSVHGSDVVDKKDWSQQRMEALITMRVIITHLGDIGVDGDDMPKYVAELWPEHLSDRFDQAATDFDGLERKEQLDAKERASLHIARSLVGGAQSEPYYLHLDKYPASFVDIDEPQWLGVMRHYYNSQGWGDYLDQDAKAAEAYFLAVRHPHVVYDSAQFEKVTQANSDIRLRLNRFFKVHRIRSEPEKEEVLPSGIKERRRLLIDRAFELYKNYFPQHLRLRSEIPFNQSLLGEVADRVELQHKVSGVGRDVIWLGVMRRIPQYNAQVNKGEKQRLDEYFVPTKGLFRVRFDRFVKEWLGLNAGDLPADRTKLMFAARRDSIDEALGLVGGDKAREFLTSWFDQQSKDLELLKTVIMHEHRGIAPFVREHYRAGMIDDGAYLINGPDFKNMALTVFRNRYSSSTDGDPYQDAFEVLGQRFDPYPEVKEDVAEFLQTGVSHYLSNLSRVLRISLERFEETLDLFGGEMPARDIDELVERVTAYSDYPIEQLPRFGSTFETVIAHERLLGLVDQLYGKRQPFIPSFGKRIEQVMQMKLRALEEKEKSEQAVDDELEALAKQEYGAHAAVVSKFMGEFAQFQNGYGAVIAAGILQDMDDTHFERHASLVEQGAKLVGGLVGQYSADVANLVPKLKGLENDLPEEDVGATIQKIKRVGDQLMDYAARFDEAVDLVDKEKNRREIKAKRAREEEWVNKAKGILRKGRVLIERLRGLSGRMKEEADRLQTIPDHFESVTLYMEAWEMLRAERSTTEEYFDNFKGEMDEEIEPVMRALKIDECLAQASELGIDQLDESTKPGRVLKELVDWLPSLEQMGKQIETSSSRLSKARIGAADRLKHAEDNWPVGEIKNLPKLVDIPNEPKLIEDGEIWTFNFPAPIFDASKKYDKMLLMSLASSLSILTIGDESFILVLEAEDRESLKGWLRGDRSGPYTEDFEGGCRVSLAAGAQPVKLRQFSDFPKRHEFNRIVRNIKLLAGKDLPGKKFLVWMYQLARSDEPAMASAAMDVSNQIILRLGDPSLKSATDVSKMVERVALALRDQVDTLYPKEGGTFFDKEPDLIRLDVKEETFRSLVSESADVHEKALLKMAEAAGVDLEKVCAAGEALFKKIDEKVSHLREGHPMALAWADYIHGNHTEEDWKKTSRFEHLPPSAIEGFMPAAAIWAFVGKAKKEGHPNAEAIGEEFLFRLWGALFPSSEYDTGHIDADLVARTAALFITEYSTELINWKFLYEDGKRIYSPKEHKAAATTLDDWLKKLDLLDQMKSFIREFYTSDRWLGVGLVFKNVFGEDAQIAEIDRVIGKVWYEYATFYQLEEGVMHDFQDLVCDIYRAALIKKREGKELPKWWFPAADKELAREMPETAGAMKFKMKWFMMNPSVSSDDPLYYPQKFVEMYPEFHEAVVILNVLGLVKERNKEVFSRFERLIKDIVTGQSDDVPQAVRKSHAKRFRDLFVENREHLRSLYQKRFEVRVDGEKMIEMAEDSLFVMPPHKYVGGIRELFRRHVGEGGENDDDDNGGSTPPIPSTPSTPSSPSAPPQSSPPVNKASASSGINNRVDNGVSVACRSPATVLAPTIGSSNVVTNAMLYSGQYLMRNRSPILTSVRI